MTEEIAKTWRNRANSAANRAASAEAKLEIAKLALGKITHIGYIDNDWVGIALTALNQINEKD